MPEDEFENEDPENPDDNSDIRQLRKAHKERDDLRSENEKLRWENALVKAGLGHLSEKQQKALRSVHEGEELTADALKASATELGIATEPTPEKNEDEIPAEELAAHRQMNDAASGAGGSGPIDHEAEMRKASSPAEVLALAGKAGLSIADPVPD